MNRIVNADGLPEPKGFSHAVIAGATVYLAGQIGEGGTLIEQFDNAAANLITALEAAGGKPQDLVSLQVFVTDIPEYVDSLPGLGRVWRARFGHHYPAMGLFGVAGLFEPDAKVELMGVAALQS
jgi:enamine deaminase RidA (YjgF/YER057c/UK114 family)